MILTWFLFAACILGTPTAVSPSYTRVYFDTTVPFKWTIDSSSSCKPTITIYDQNNTEIMNFVTQVGSTSWDVTGFLRGGVTSVLKVDDAPAGTFLWQVTQCGSSSALVPFYVVETGSLSVQWPDLLTPVNASESYTFKWYNAGLTCTPLVEVYDYYGVKYFSSEGTASVETLTVADLMPQAPTGSYYASVTICGNSATSAFNFVNSKQRVVTSNIVSVWESDAVVTQTWPAITSFYVSTVNETDLVTIPYTYTFETTMTVTTTDYPL